MRGGCSWSLASGRTEFPSTLWDFGFWALLSFWLPLPHSFIPKSCFGGWWGVMGRAQEGIRAAPPARTTGLAIDAQSGATGPRKNPSHHGPGVSYLCTQTFSSLLSLTTEQHLQFSHQARGHHVIFGLSLSFPPNPPALPKHGMLPESPSSAFSLIWGCCSEVFSLEG